MSILPDVREILALLYTDRMSVCRYPENTTDEDGALIVDASLVPVERLEDVPCRLSLSSKDSPMMGDDMNPIDVQPTLICRPDVPLKSGDYITVRRLVNKTDGIWADTYAGHIGRPSRYGSSLQVVFRDKDVS